MTYITPDDWHANHNLAPGDARLPQKPMQPVMSWSASKGLAPTPPMRGYFGPRPHYPKETRTITQSPWAVSDVMWGVHGLDDLPVAIRRNLPRQFLADGLDATSAYARADQILAAANDKMKREMQASAATNTSIAIGLNFIPVVGSVIAVVYGVVMGISNAHYKSEAAKVMAGLQTELNQLGADYQIRLQRVLDQVFEEVKPTAIQLSISNQPLNGLGTLGRNIFKDVADAIFNPAVQVKGLLKVAAAPVHYAATGAAHVIGGKTASVIMKADDATYGDASRMANKLVDVSHAMTGEDLLDRARRAADDARVAFRQKMDQLYTEQVTLAASPQYRASLIVTIARYLRENPIAGQLLTGQINAANASPQELQEAQNISTSMNSKASTILPAIAAAGAALIFLGVRH